MSHKGVTQAVPRGVRHLGHAPLPGRRRSLRPRSPPRMEEGRAGALSLPAAAANVLLCRCSAAWQKTAGRA